MFAAGGGGGVRLLGTLPYPVIRLATSNIDAGVLLSSYCGLLLLISSFISVGLFFSAMTENQVIAFVLTMGTLLFMWVLAGASYSAGPIWGEFIRYASIFTHFSNFGSGVLDTSDIIYYLSVIGLGLFATNLAFDANQWS